MNIQSQLAALPGVGNTRAAALVKAGVTKLSDLKLPQFAAMITIETKYHVLFPIDTAITWDRAHDLVEFFRRHLDVIGVGSYRRKRPLLHDIDLLTTANLSDISQQTRLLAAKIAESSATVLSTFRYIGEYASGTKRLSMIVRFRERYYRVDFFKTTPAEYPYALLHFTGSVEFNIKVRSAAKAKGLKLNQSGLYKDTTLIPCKTERAVLAAIGIKYVAPEKRL